MKEVIFLRHAKSDWATEFLKDIDRPLNERGYGDAYFLSQWFTKNFPQPDRLITSTATRAFSTAMIFALAMELPQERISLEPRIYESPAQRIIHVLSECKEAEGLVMVVGHNPGFTDACNFLSDKNKVDDVSTCGIVHLKLNIGSWKEIGEDCGEIELYQYPKNFKNQE